MSLSLFCCTVLVISGLQQGHVIHPGSTPPASISGPAPPRGATPPRTIPNTPPHNIMTTPPPQSGIPSQAPLPAASGPRHSSPVTTSVPHIRTMAPPAVVTSEGLPPGLPRHPMAHNETQAIIHQGIMVRPEVAIHPGMCSMG